MGWRNTEKHGFGIGTVEEKRWGRNFWVYGNVHSNQKVSWHKFNISPESVRKIIQKVKKTGSAKHIARLGRPRVTSARDDRKIIGAVKANPKISTRELKETLCLPVAEQTIKNRLNDACFFERRARNKTFINKINKKKLLEFAHTYLNYPVEFWRKVLITDESRFELRSDTRKKNQILAPKK